MNATNVVIGDATFDQRGATGQSAASQTSGAAGARLIDFDLRLVKTGTDAYRVEAQTVDGWLARALLDWAALQGETMAERLRRLREEPFTVREPDLRKMGGVLFAALFTGDVLSHFTGTFRYVVQPAPDACLRIRLDIAEDAPELARLPWELMYWNGMFLATQPKTLVTRQLLSLDYGAIKPLAIAGKPAVLIVAPGGSGLNSAAEAQAIGAVLTRVGIAYDVLEGRVAANDVADRMAVGQYGILHFIGHGRIQDEEDGLLHGSLRFNTSAGDGSGADEDWVSDTRLRMLLGPIGGLRLVVLNACHGAEVTGADEQGSFIGLGPALLKAGIPAVVAMQYRIRDDVAVRFAGILYKRLSEGHWTGQIDAAVNLARNGCFIEFPDDRGFATPVLYLRSRDGVLFQPRS